MAVIATYSSFVSCSGTPQTLPVHNLVVDDVQRQYHLFVPSSPSDQPMPLIIAFHGGGGAGEAFQQQSRFESLAQTEGFIMAFPQGYLDPGNEGEWQLNTRPEAYHDINFINAMIDEISEERSVNPSRIYAIGYSLGSMFTYEVACQMSDRVAAIASFAGTMPISPTHCEPQRNVSIMHIHGVDDTIIAYGQTWGWKAWDEVGDMRDIPSLVEYWRSKYSCRDSGEMNSTSGVHFVHTMCDQGARLEHHRVNNIGHTWPDQINGVSTHQVIWNFLSDFSLERD
jgi:polyhydroxybutyrate depolymerase